MNEIDQALNEMLLLGDPRLYEVAEAIQPHELDQVPGWVARLHRVMEAIRARYHFGRGIAAPQLGIPKRLIYINVGEPLVIINPTVVSKSDELFEVWDDCMCFPNLLVKVMRHRSITLRFRDANWQEQERVFSDDMAELLQHEYDHLDGILCTMRAIDDKSFRWRK